MVLFYIQGKIHVDNISLLNICHTPKTFQKCHDHAYYCQDQDLPRSFNLNSF